jgi:hypothetical protein
MKILTIKVSKWLARKLRRIGLEDLSINGRKISGSEEAWRKTWKNLPIGKTSRKLVSSFKDVELSFPVEDWVDHDEFLRIFEVKTFDNSRYELDYDQLYKIT